MCFDKCPYERTLFAAPTLNARSGAVVRRPMVIGARRVYSIAERYGIAYSDPPTTDWTVNTGCCWNRVESGMRCC